MAWYSRSDLFLSFLSTELCSILLISYLLRSFSPLKHGSASCNEESKSLLGHLRECTITFRFVFPHLGLFIQSFVSLRHMHGAGHLHQQCVVRELLWFSNPRCRRSSRVSFSALTFSVASALQVIVVVIERHRPPYNTIAAEYSSTSERLYDPASPALRCRPSCSLEILLLLAPLACLLPRK